MFSAPPLAITISPPSGLPPIMSTLPQMMFRSTENRREICETSASEALLSRYFMRMMHSPGLSCVMDAPSSISV